MIAISTSLRVKPIDDDKQEFQIENNESLSSFSHYLNPTQSQSNCYTATCSDIIPQFLQGRNCTLFVYGQTGSGKTHTLFGPPNSFHSGVLSSSSSCLQEQQEEQDYEVFPNGHVNIPKSWGIFPRVILDLLHSVSTSSSKQYSSSNNNSSSSYNNTNNNVGITATAVEIYMDNCYDLMRDKQKIAVAGFGRSTKVSGRGSFLETTQIQRDSSGRWIPPRTTTTTIHPNNNNKNNSNEGYEMKGAKSHILTDVHSLLDFMKVVEATRTSKSHKLNERSSRSHCVIALSIPFMSQAKFLLIDLAGSERIMKSGTIRDELKAAEAKNINVSLTALGRCIRALAKQKKSNNNSFVPYRDSVLTMLLKQSLGGRCYTSVIITASADKEMASETLSSIQFGMRCSKVSNKSSSSSSSTTTTTINTNNFIHITQSSQEKNNDGTTTITKNEMNMTRHKQYLYDELSIIDSEIQIMKNSKSGAAAGGLNPEFPYSLQQSFSSNMKKYQTFKENLEHSIQLIKAGKTSNDILKTKRYQESQVRNLQGILLRSMTTGVWMNPSPRYVKYLQEREDILTQLRGMNAENVELIPVMEVPLTLEHLLHGFTG